METKLSDVAHMYSGCRVIINRGGKQFLGILQYVGIPAINFAQRYGILIPDLSTSRYEYENTEKLKPLLYPLSAMMEEQMTELIAFRNGLIPLYDQNFILAAVKEMRINKRDGRCITIFTEGHTQLPQKYRFQWNNLYTDEFLYCLKNSFDMFNLIESGETLDATKFNQ